MMMHRRNKRRKNDFIEIQNEGLHPGRREASKYVFLAHELNEVDNFEEHDSPFTLQTDGDVRVKVFLEIYVL